MAAIVISDVLSFDRNNAGDVTMTFVDSLLGAQEHKFDAHTWAHLVANASVIGATAEQHEAVGRLTDGR